MIPLFAVVRFRNERNRSFGLWVPLFLIWLLLLPLVFLLLPVFFVFCAVGEVNAFRALVTLWQILTSLRNTHIEVAQRRTLVQVHTY